MALESGYYYITLSTFTATLNPTRSSTARADKKIVNVVTLTQTIKQHWQKLTSDKYITMEWDSLPKADLDVLIVLDEANYTYYAFTDEYNSSYNVIISELKYDRLTQLDSDGYSVSIRLEVVS